VIHLLKFLWHAIVFMDDRIPALSLGPAMEQSHGEKAPISSVSGGSMLYRPSLPSGLPDGMESIGEANAGEPFCGLGSPLTRWWESLSNGCVKCLLVATSSTVLKESHHSLMVGYLVSESLSSYFCCHGVSSISHSG
jgi:hypothetical protein